MGKIPIVVCYDGRWDESNRYVDNRIKGVLVSECASFSSLLELLYNELYLDFHKHHANLFVNMQLDSSENSVVELKSDGAVAWFLSIAKDDKQMKFPLVVHVEAFPMHDLIEKSAISSNNVFGSDVMGIRLNFEHSSSFDNTNEASSSTLSCITSKSDSNTSMLEFIKASKVDDLKENYLFSGKEEIKKALHVIAIRKNFEFKTMKSDERRLIVQCIGVGCAWFMRASRYKGGDLWLVRKYINKHTCSLDLVVGDHKQATSAMISELIKGHLNLGVENCADPNDIIEHMRMRHGINISYAKARRARELALASIRGSPKQSYAQLPSYLFMLKSTNPGTIADYETDDEGEFKYLFVCLDTSIKGWIHCRPIVCVDGTFMKCKYGGTLLIACALDGNNQIFPLAYGVGDSGNDDCWEWFFNNLKDVIGDREDLVFVIDRHKSIGKAILKVFPNAHHGVCIYHLLNNLKTQYKFIGNDGLFNQCARAYLQTDFEYFMHKIEEIQLAVSEYLHKAGLERWARPHFVSKRFSIMTSNISESLNSALRYARELPITSMLEHIRQMLQNWFRDRRMAAAYTKTELTTWAEAELRDRRHVARTMTVRTIGYHQHQVIDGFVEFVVHMGNKTCSCRKWELDLIPFSHACAVINRFNLSFYSNVSSFFFNKTLVSTYDGLVHPVGNKFEWKIPENIREAIVMEPNEEKAKAGRPKKHRIKSAGEFKKTVRCGHCGRVRHNRKICKNPVPKEFCNRKQRRMRPGVH